MNYWEECISDAFDQAGMTASMDQIEIVARLVKSGHDCYGMAHGNDSIRNPLESENKRLKLDLENERGKGICEKCLGDGNVVEDVLGRLCVSECQRCGGDGLY